MTDSFVTIHNADELFRALKSNPFLLLLVCTGNHETHEEQVEHVRHTGTVFRNTLAVGQVAEEFSARFSGIYQVKGSPTCLVFENGRVRDRILGFTDRDTLIDRVAIIIQSHKRDNINHMEEGQ